jgi:hypothetical protein
MTLLKKVMKRLYRIALIPKTRREIACLYGESNLVSKSLANALRATLENSVTPEEKAWVDRIESLRNMPGLYFYSSSLESSDLQSV